MTNSSPQEPQNPVPEERRRRRGIAGLTTDELIAMFVAFTTIGIVLLWSFGTKKGGFLGNFGLGKQDSLLSGDRIGLELGSIGRDTKLKFGAIATRSSDAIASDALVGSKSGLDLDASASEFEGNGEQETTAYQLDRDNKLAALAVGGAALPGLSNNNLNQGTRGNVGVVPRTSTTPRVTAPDADPIPEREEPSATAPDTDPVPEREEPSATAPDTDPVPEKTEMPEDIAPSYWAYPFVKQMSDRALVADLTEDADFEPDKLITRASMATLISQAFGDRPSSEATKTFSDVTNQNAIAADIDKAVSTGFMQGYSEDEFRPLENIPRYQVLVTLATGLGLKPSQDADAILQNFRDGTELPDWAKQQVAAAAEAGLIVNRPNVAQNQLSPQQEATRGEVAAMIHQALVLTNKLQPIESEYIIQP